MAGVKFVDKDTVVENVLSNTTGFLPMWQDNGALKVPVSMLRMQAVASCTSAAGTVAKSATISNMPDFELRNGLIITVAFTNGNSASSPTLNINEKGAWPLRCEGQASSVTIGDGCWSAGALITVQYVEVDSSHKYFLMLGHNVASVNSVTGITTRADGTQVCSTTALNSALSNYAPIVKTFNSNTNGTSISFSVSDLGLYRITVYRGNYMSIYYATYIGGSTYLILQYNTSANPVLSTSISGRTITLTLTSWGYVCGVIERLK